MRRSFTLFTLALICQISFPQLCEDSPTIAWDTTIFNPCLGKAEAQIQVDVTGGTEPYSYTWRGPNDFESHDTSIYNLYAGIYFLSLRDANGCALVGSYWDTVFQVLDQDPIAVSIDTSRYNGYNVSEYGAWDGWIKVQNGIGNGPFQDWTYKWTHDSKLVYNTRNIEHIPAGNFVLELHDSIGCYHEESVTLREPPYINICTDTLYDTIPVIVTDTVYVTVNDTNYVTIQDTSFVTINDTVFQFLSGCIYEFTDELGELTVELRQVDEMLYLSEPVDVILYDLSGKKLLEAVSTNQVDIGGHRGSVLIIEVKLSESVKFRDKIYFY